MNCQKIFKNALRKSKYEGRRISNFQKLDNEIPELFWENASLLKIEKK